MSEVLKKDKDIVVPGEIVAKGMDLLPSYGTYRKDENIIANMLGMIRINGNVIKLTPLAGGYNPQKGDKIIAKVVDILFSGWRLDIENCGSTSVLSLQEGSTSFINKGEDLTNFYEIGDYVYCVITNVTSQKLIDVSIKGPGLRKLNAGRIININSCKVPRVIGKQGSMVNLIKDATGSIITIGQNGLIWIKNSEPEKENLTVDAIKFIEKNAHRSGLTDKMRDFFSEKGLNVEKGEN
jgi:exosome complex component RRP4